jgi:hypothetical protein
MRITIDQMDQLGRGMRARFERDCVRLLRQQHADKTARHDDATLLAFVQHGVDRAARLQVHGATDVVAWLELMLLLGPRFDEDPRHARVQGVLADLEAPACVRLTQAQSLARAQAAAAPP